MSDLMQRLRNYSAGPEDCERAADRIEDDEALLRQALDALVLCNMHGWVLADHEAPIEQAIAALRERLC